MADSGSGLDGKQVAAYLERLGIDRPAAPDSDALRGLHRAHLLAVPFENLSIHLGEPIALDPDSVLDKLLIRRRGGFCYEVNGGFALLLEALGYQVERVSARSHGRAEIGPPFDHLALLVRPDDGTGTWLIDVGYGRDTPAPLRFDVREDQVVDGVTYRLADAPDGDVDLLVDGEPAYRMELRPRSIVDFVPTSWWQQTAPESHFTQGTICSVLTATGRTSISGRTLIVTSDGSRTETTLDSDEEVLAAYREHFGIVLDRVPEVRARD